MRVKIYTRPTNSEGERQYVPADPAKKNAQGAFYLRYTLHGRRIAASNLRRRRVHQRKAPIRALGTVKAKRRAVGRKYRERSRRVKQVVVEL